MKLIGVLCGALLVFGCAGSNAPAAHPADVPGSLGDAPPPPEATEAIPQYFWVEVSGNELIASGDRVDRDTLRTIAVREASSGQVRGAALTLNDYTTEEQALDAVRLLLDAGFRHVVLSSRVGLVTAQASSASTPAPGESVAIQPAPAVVNEPELVAEPEPPATPPAAPASEGPRVEVKQMGLHIGGGPNDAEHHAFYAEPIGRRFEDLRQCYALVQGNRKQASFGVDLLIPSKGGTPKIENYRTAIGGKDFHLCVLGVFGSVSFKAPGKATMVSYSVLFKPL